MGNTVQHRLATDKTLKGFKEQMATDNSMVQTHLQSIANSIAMIAQSDNAAVALAQMAKTIADEANLIAKQAQQAKIFDTEALMLAWLKDENNAGKLDLGYNLYIKDVDVPDYWISEVRTTPDADGLYYGISKLETGKVNLSNVVTTNSDNATTIDSVFGMKDGVSKNISAADLASVVAGMKSITVGTLDPDTMTEQGIYLTYEHDKSPYLYSVIVVFVFRIQGWEQIVQMAIDIISANPTKFRLRDNGTWRSWR